MNQSVFSVKEVVFETENEKILFGSEITINFVLR
jgi:hypothetical protein